GGKGGAQPGGVEEGTVPPSPPGPGHHSPYNPLRMPPRGAPHSSYPVPHQHRSQGVLRHLSVPGLTLGLILLWGALSPSLLPRAWWMTAVNVGVCLAFGYLIGSQLGRFVSWLSYRTDLRVEIN